jgi:hypothetical protein
MNYSFIPGPVKDYNFNMEQSLNNSIKKELENEDPYSTGLRNPTKNNPFMNLPISAYDTNQVFNDYDRYDTKGVTTEATQKTSNEVDKKFINKLFQDPAGYLFDRNNSQRQFYSVPVGSVPNNQDEFASWLYLTPGNCKNGSIYMRQGVRFTDDSLLCTGFQAAEPTNFGILK